MDTNEEARKQGSKTYEIKQGSKNQAEHSKKSCIQRSKKLIRENKNQMQKRKEEGKCKIVVNKESKQAHHWKQRDM